MEKISSNYKSALLREYDDLFRGQLLEDESSSIDLDGIAEDVAELCLEEDSLPEVLPHQAKERPTAMSHARGVWRVRPISDNRFVSASYDGTAKVWNPKNDKSKPHVLFGGFKSPKRKECLSVAQLTDGTIITGFANGTMKLWDGKTYDSKGFIKEPDNQRFGFYSMTPMKENRLATGACQKPNKSEIKWNHVIKLWNLQDCNQLAKKSPECVLKGHTGGISEIVSLQDDTIASSSADKTICLWDLNKKAASQQLKGHEDYVYSLAECAPNILASGSRDRKVFLWDTRMGSKCGELKMPKALQAHASTVYDVASYGENGVLTASRDAYIKLWDRRNTDRAVKVLDTEDAFAYSVCSVTDGLIAAGTCSSFSKDKPGGNVRVWELK